MNGSVAFGSLRVDPPVVLAPMAGVTNAAFRRLCREYATGSPAAPQEHADGGRRRQGGLFVSEMVTSRALVERHAETMAMLHFSPEEVPRSLQLYGVDPQVVGRAVAMVVDEDRADHVDLNFGCPVPKVTRRGGGAALPWKRDLLRDIVRAAVRSADGRVPVTMKMRMGIDDEHLTYLDAGRIAEDAGVSAVALHARTAAQSYSGSADWDAIAALKARVTTIPVLGNGDVWEADDALRMMRETGCDGVVVGRGCLGRPWLFGELAAAFAGLQAPARPTLGEVARTMRRHAQLLSELMGEQRGVRDFRKHVAWYLKGFVAGSAIRARLGMVASLTELDDLLGTLEPDAPFPAESIGSPRGRTNSPRAVALPEGWLDDRTGRPAESAELALSGG